MTMRTVLSIGTIVFVLFLVGCGREEAPPTEQPPQPTAGPAAPVDLATAATITGKVVYQDGKPRRNRIRMGADPACTKLHASPVYSQEVVVNDNGTLRHVFVYVSQGLEGRTFTPPSEPVVLDQKGCVYEPHVVGAQTNQDIQVLNSDPTTHNIHPVPTVNREWNTSMPPGAEPLVRAFPREEVAIPVKCNIHPWMRSYIAVVKHPYFAVTGSDGSFEIKNLPPGQYTITAWQEKYGTTEQEVALGPKETKSIEFVFPPSATGK